MFRTDFLNTYDSSKPETIIDKFFRRFGGTLYDNVWTPCPDTARSLSAFWSGIPCYENGCNKRGKYPAEFLREKSFLDQLEDNGYEIRLLSKYKSRFDTIFPKKYTSGEYQFKELELLKEAPSKSFTFIDIPDVHHILDDLGYTKETIKIAHNQLLNSLNLIFRKIDKLSFDKIMFFSDHGHLINTDRNLDNAFIGKARSRIFMQYWDKKSNGFNTDNTFLSITDISKFITNDYKNLKNVQSKDSILIEDFKSLESKIEQVPNIWMYKKMNNELIFNNFELTNYFYARDELFLEVITKFPHLKNLLDEYIVYNNYLSMKSKKTKGNQYYFDNKKRRTSLKVIFQPILYKSLYLTLPPFLVTFLKKIKFYFTTSFRRLD